jgi:hypothetical protein
MAEASLRCLVTCCYPFGFQTGALEENGKTQVPRGGCLSARGLLVGRQPLYCCSLVQFCPGLFFCQVVPLGEARTTDVTAAELRVEVQIPGFRAQIPCSPELRGTLPSLLCLTPKPEASWGQVSWNQPLSPREGLGCLATDSTQFVHYLDSSYGGSWSL